MSIHYNTLSEGTSDLKSRGFIMDFEVNEDGMITDTDQRFTFDPSTCVIKEVYRFEGMSNPSDNSILYAIEVQGGLKGSLIDAYGTYSNEKKEAAIKKMKNEHRE